MAFFDFTAEITVHGEVAADSAEEAEEALFDYLEAEGLTSRINIFSADVDVLDVELGEDQGEPDGEDG